MRRTREERKEDRKERRARIKERIVEGVEKLGEVAGETVVEDGPALGRMVARHLITRLRNRFGSHGMVRAESLLEELEAIERLHA